MIIVNYLYDEKNGVYFTRIFSSFLDPTRHAIILLYLVFDFGTFDVVSIILEYIKLHFKINMIYFVKFHSLLPN